MTENKRRKNHTDLECVKEDLKLVVDGDLVPSIDLIITTQNWAQFTETWNFQDLNGNTLPPFVTTVRQPEVKYKINRQKRFIVL